jgi:hypothetical protein
VTSTIDVPALNVRVMGVTIAIDPKDQATRDRLAHQWARAVASDTDETTGRRVEALAGPDDEGTDTVDYAVTTQVTLAALIVTSGQRFNLHAGGLADEQGRVLALVGRSGTGKTTATRLLAERLDYLSDETVSITPDGLVHPHAKPLSVITDPERPTDKAQLSPDDLGLRPTPDTGRLARFVVLRRGVPDPRGLVLLEPMEGLMSLIEQSSSVSETADPLVTLLSLIDATGGVWALEYDEIHDHLDDLERLLAEEIAPVDRPRPPHHPGDIKGVAPAEVAANMVRRLPWADAIELDDELLVLLGERAVRLDNLMATLWLSLGTPLTVADLVVAAQSRHGDHPDAHDLVEKAVAVMAEQGLVAWGTLA